VQGPPTSTQFKKNNFLVTVKSLASGYQTLSNVLSTLPTKGVYGRLVHVGETFNRFADFGAVSCTKMRLAAGLRQDPLEEL